MAKKSEIRNYYFIDVYTAVSEPSTRTFRATLPVAESHFAAAVSHGTDFLPTAAADCPASNTDFRPHLAAL